MKQNLEKLLSILIFSGIILIIFLPLFGDYGKLFYPLARDILFRIIIEILFFLYLFLVIVNRNYLPKFSPLLVLVLIFWLIYGLSTIFSTQPYFSLWGNIFRGQGFFSFTHFILFFLILTGFLKRQKQWKKIIFLAIVVSIPIGFLSLLETQKGTLRALGTLNNPNFLAAYILLVFFITLSYLFQEKKLYLKIICFFALFFQIVGLNAAKSRGGYLGFGAGIIFFFFLWFWQKLKNQKKLKFLILSFFIFGLVLTFLKTPILSLTKEAIFWPDNFANKLKKIDLSALDRFEAIEVGISGLKEKPYFGFGPENFIVASDKYYKGRKEGPGYPWLDRGHNFISDIGISTGLLGLFSYLVIFFHLFFSLSKKIKRTQENFWLIIGLLSTFFAYLSQNLFNFDTTTSQIYLFLWLGLANFIQQNAKKEMLLTSEIEEINKRKNFLLLIISLIFLPILLFSLWRYNLKSLWANLKLQEGETFLAQGNYQSAFEKFEEGLKINSSAVNFYLRYRYASAISYYALWQKFLYQPQNKEILKKGISLIEENIKAISPRFTRNYTTAGTLANFLFEAGEKEYQGLADYYFENALKLSPKRPSILLEWSKTDLISNDLIEAEEKINKAWQINKENPNLYWQWGILNLLKRNSEKAEIHFTRAQNLGYSLGGFESLNELGLIYNQIGDYQKAIEIYEKLVKGYPKNYEYRQILEKVYQKSKTKTPD